MLAATNTPTGIYLVGVNNGFRLSVPADTQVRALKLYVGVWAAQGKAGGDIKRWQCAGFRGHDVAGSEHGQRHLHD
ncbi:MAG: hypothetical protein WKF84_22920 [Pyrinomonadaceae bacterium]